MFETIVALATPPLKSALAIIRLSGDDCFEIVSKIFTKDLTKINSRGIHFGYIVDNNNYVDQVVLLTYVAPHSFTGEDSVEIICHGSMVIANEIIKLIISKGARMATNGEFSSRAYLNKKIDLVQAEAINDIINATTIEAKDLAMHSLDGETSKIFLPIKTKIGELISHIEVNIDYPEYEDIEVLTNEKITPEIKNLLQKIKDIIKKSSDGKIINEGINIGIVGRPNVGKSSLLNALIEEDKAIVTDIEGTTRDIVEGKFILNGIVCNIIDTAGIRKTDNLVEQIGVDKSYEIIEKADLIIYLLNNNEKLTIEDKKLLEKVKQKKNIVVLNKIDLEKNIDISDEEIIKMSIKNNIGINELKNKIINLFNLEKISTTDPTYLTSARSIALLNQAYIKIEEGLNKINDFPIDLIEIDLKEAWSLLGEIIGKTYKEELIDEIFSRFCLGK